ncbi:carbonic anhydrase 1-like protein [Leptotrombidium deliense]|uniref:Carbonic anhydrase 1-like protein n=1 Tax=Leptotrombidium deliense TaxID=299467 RepID=A0A443SC55_9ACAR|nr:carbonic anhydrase 1-like protein [Leptotrombidium deliense]
MFSSVAVYIIRLKDLFLVNATGGSSDDWHYIGDTGQDKWPELFDTCTGKKQSPIDIRTSSIVVNSSLKVEFLDYKVPLSGKNSVFVNDGHSAKLLPNFKNSDHLMKINVSSFPGMNFALLQLHFHWGESEHMGSEHAVNGKKYAAEVGFHIT